MGFPYHLLSENFIKTRGITDSTKYEILEVDPRILLTPERIDLSAKIAYIRAVDTNMDLEFAREFYLKHIEAFSDGYFNEPGDDNKTSIDDFFREFDALIKSIKEVGFDNSKSLIPVGKDNIILDGAHRTACAIYFKKNVEIIKFEDFEFNFNYEYFRRKMLTDELLGYMAIDYARYSNAKLYCACIWPASPVEKRQQVLDFINSNGKIVYETDVQLDYEGLRNLMVQIYGHQNWIGTTKDNFIGVNGKVDPCYVPGVPCKIVLFEGGELDEVLKMKDDIREIFNIGKHALHISDTLEETRLMTNLLFSNSSVLALNYGRITREEELYLKLKTMNKSGGLLPYEYTLAFFGIRKLTANISETNFATENFREYFVYDGLRLMALDVVKIYLDEKNIVLSGEENEKMSQLLNTVKNQDKIRKQEYKKVMRTWKKEKRILKLKQILVKVAEKLGIYNFLHKLTK
ncbi:MAG: hypothetical protein PUE69_00430 [Ruminococcus sp.]|nr:hypothetical protein [Ruminococcus sp.]